MSNSMSIKEMMVLIDMKNNEPEKYKQFLKDMGEVMKDTLQTIKDIGEDLE